MDTTKSYKTRQRGEILLCLMDNRDRHITVEEIMSLLAAKGENVGKATVYRTLDRLVLEGEVKKYISEEGKSACYQYGPQGEKCRRHFHLKCSRCNKLIHLECDFLSEIAQHIYQEHQFTIDSSKTVFYGLCAECGGKEKNA